MRGVMRTRDMSRWSRGLTLVGALVLVSACATLVDGVFPRSLMRAKAQPIWAESSTPESCSGYQLHSTLSVIPVSLELRLTTRSSDGVEQPITNGTVWLRETLFDSVQRISFHSNTVSVCKWHDAFDEPECRDLSPLAGPAVALTLQLHVDADWRCVNGQHDRSEATFPYVILAQAPACRDKVFLLRDKAGAPQPIELECEVRESHNNRLKLAARG
jgi:hypothetical protein